MAVNSPQGHFCFPAVLLAILYLIIPINCKSYSPISNSSLKTQTLYRYSKEAALSHPFHQTRACSSENSPCTSSRDCCQYSDTEGFVPIICSESADSSLTCQRCISQSTTACDVDNDKCCIGYTCIAGTCTATDQCFEQDEPCNAINPRCCGALNCIADSEGKFFCSDQCSMAHGHCREDGSQSNCCTGNMCSSTSYGPVCYCLGEYSTCTPGSTSLTCCVGLECDPVSTTCKPSCKPPGTDCDSTQTAEENNCCAGSNCKASINKCCSAQDSQCDPTAAEDICCDGLQCGRTTGDEGSTCQPCVSFWDSCSTAAGSPSCCYPNTCDLSTSLCCGAAKAECSFTEGSDTCCIGQTCDSTTNTCCTNENYECDIDDDTCCDGLECVEIDGSGVCKPPCVDALDSCNVGGDSRPCCSPYTCGSENECCALENVPCDITNGVNTCCTGLTCKETAGSQTCQPICIAQGSSCTPNTDTCCDNNQCIETGGVATCQPKCVNSGETCRSSHKDHGWGWGPAGSDPCCSPLTCDSYNYKCCAAKGIPCNNTSPCCRGLTCDTSNNVCIEKPCVQRETTCGESDICCDKLTCDPKLNVCRGGAWAPCDNTNLLCSSDHKCNPENSLCKPERCFDYLPPPYPTICIKDPHHNNDLSSK